MATGCAVAIVFESAPGKSPGAPLLTLPVLPLAVPPSDTIGKIVTAMGGSGFTR
jgi:hypothetical protein